MLTLNGQEILEGGHTFFYHIQESVYGAMKLETMSTSASRKRIHFITVDDPGKTSSAQARKASKSHAAREAHAKARRLRMQEYQSQNDVPGKNGSSDTINAPLVQSGGGQGPWKPTLVELASYGYRDPLPVLDRPMTDQEHFLFHHCECGCMDDGCEERVTPNLLCIDMSSVAPRLRDWCPKLGFYDELLPDWLSLLVSDIGLLYSALLTASRHIQVYHWFDRYAKSAVQSAAKYKLLCLQELRQAMQTEAVARSFSLATIAKAFVLAFDEVSTVPDYASHRKLDLTNDCSWDAADGLWEIQSCI